MTYPEILIDKDKNTSVDINSTMSTEERYDFMHHTHNAKDIIRLNVGDNGNITVDPTELTEVKQEIQTLKDEVNTSLDKKLDKEDGKSLVEDTEIERLKSVDNYDDTDIKTALDNKVDKEEGKSLVEDSVIEELKNIKAYDDTEIKEQISTKVNAVEGKSLVSDELVTKLESLDNYDDTDIKTQLGNKVDAVEGKSLIDDTEIERLKSVDNYDDTSIKEQIAAIPTYSKELMEKELKEDRLVNTEMSPYYDETLGMFFAQGMPIKIDKDDSGDKAIKISWIGGSKVFEDGSKIAVFGGGDAVAITHHYPHTKITMNSGIVQHLCAGNNVGGTVDTGEIIINGGTIAQCAVGGSFTWSDYYKKMYPGTVYNTKITLNDGAIKLVLYGGGNGACSNMESSVELNVKGGSVYYMCAGGSNGNTNNATVNISGGTVDVYQSTNRGTVGDVEINVTGGTVNKLYCGGAAETDISGTIESVKCNLTGGKVGHLYLGTDGSTAKATNQAYVERKLDLSKVSGTYKEGVIDSAEGGILDTLTLLQ
mgnify:CR=1 FL=1